MILYSNFTSDFTMDWVMSLAIHQWGGDRENIFNFIKLIDLRV